MANVNLKIGYSDSADRLWLRVADHPASWWLTRRLALAWVGRWADRLEAAPPGGLAQWLGSGEGYMAREHALAKEPENDRASEGSPVQGAVTPVTDHFLLSHIGFRAEGEHTRLTLRGDGQRLVVTLNRIDSHRLIHALIRQMHRAGWLATPHFPDWLDSGGD
jgi:hypothetical protein